MSTAYKAAQLARHKALATGLFFLMLVVYIGMTWYSRVHAAAWIGYIKAFSEAGMVGALADWFAVTALFHHPLGIPIPHTNLIEKGKKSIGSNLGNFVVTNFLTSSNIRPYIQKLSVSGYAAGWLGRAANKELLIRELSHLMLDILQKVDDRSVAGFMARKGRALLDEMKLNVFAGNAAHFFLEKGEHQKLVTLLAKKISTYIGEHESLVREKVSAESYFFIPGFVDRKLAEKITGGIVKYFQEIEADQEHRIRDEISIQLYAFVERFRTEPEWEEKFKKLSLDLLPQQKLEEYTAVAWQAMKATLYEELHTADSALSQYLSKIINELSASLKNDVALQKKIDGWIRHNAYRYILRNALQVGELISNTIGNWESRELSRKLELEVGKDLQFIRINGTIVGGMVGLLIYSITEWLA